MRAFGRRTHFTPELEKAVTLDYVVTAIQRVWHFRQRSTDLFKGYVDKWLNNKTEASGWPDDCETEEARHLYVEEYNQRYSIRVVYEKVESNPGLKIVSKRSWNSFWGKFGENLGKINVDGMGAFQRPVFVDGEYFDIERRQSGSALQEGSG